MWGNVNECVHRTFFWHWGYALDRNAITIDLLAVSLPPVYVIKTLPQLHTNSMLWRCSNMVYCLKREIDKIYSRRLSEGNLISVHVVTSTIICRHNRSNIKISVLVLCTSRSYKWKIRGPTSWPERWGHWIFTWHRYRTTEQRITSLSPYRPDCRPAQSVNNKFFKVVHTVNYKSRNYILKIETLRWYSELLILPSAVRTHTSPSFSWIIPSFLSADFRAK